MLARASISDYAWALGAVAISTVGCMIAGEYFDVADQAMFYLLAILVVARRLSPGPSAFAAVASVAALNFFFVPPRFTFAVNDARHLVTFGVMLVVGLVVSNLTAITRERERRTAALYAMSRELAVIDEASELARVAARHVGELFGAGVMIVLDGELLAGTRGSLTEAERELAARASSSGRTQRTAAAIAVPMNATGVCLVDRSPAAGGESLLETFVAQLAPAIERAQLAASAEQARIAAETEQARNTLLAGLSHDLRNPLASIGGSSSILLDATASIDEAGRRELLETIRDESARLTRLVTGLLDLVRIESGALVVRKTWCPLEEVLASAISRLDLDGREVRCALGEEIVLAAVDPVLFEQVLINLLDNAAKYSPAGTPIEIRAASEACGLRIDVEDRGPGLPQGEEERIFEKFYRASDRSRAEGAGLGLALSDAIVKAHGGRMQARNAGAGGTIVSISLPAEVRA